MYCWGATQGQRGSTGIGVSNMDGRAPELVIDAEDLSERFVTDDEAARARREGGAAFGDIRSKVTALAMSSATMEMAVATKSGRVRIFKTFVTHEDPPELQNQGISRLAFGAAHACAASDTKMWCWGKNSNGQLASGDLTESDRPREITGFRGSITAISAGSYNTCVSTTEGLFCSGVGMYVGNGAFSNVLSLEQVHGLPAGQPVTSLAVGTIHVCATVGSDVYCWGDNADQATGAPHSSPLTAEDMVTMRPRKVDLGRPALSVTSGVQFSCAAVADGVRCWGDGTHAQLGIANFDPALPLGHTRRSRWSFAQTRVVPGSPTELASLNPRASHVFRHLARENLRADPKRMAERLYREVRNAVSG